MKPSSASRTAAARAARWGHPIVRFFARVQITESCWVWAGGKRRKGYGALDWNGRRRGAHQVSWEIANGPVPDGLHVLHSCDNPSCVRLAHLRLGTNKENHAERVAKGRSSRHGCGAARRKAVRQ